MDFIQDGWGQLFQAPCRVSTQDRSLSEAFFPSAQEEWTSLKLLPPALVVRARLTACVGRSFELFERLWRTKVVFVAPKR